MDHWRRATCWREGASIIHYHARDPVNGAPATDVQRYADTLRRIKQDSDPLTMPTLGAWWLPSVEARIAHVVEMARDPSTRPEFAPIDMVTSNVDAYDAKTKRFRTEDTVYVNTTKTWKYFADTMRTAGVKPMQALWNVSSVRATQAFVDMGIFVEPVYCELVLTENWLLSGHPGTVKGMQALLDFIPSAQNWQWSVLCAAGSLLPLVAVAIERGGHIAIGLGDYHYPELQRPTNAQLVARVTQIARAMGREVLSPAEAREILGVT